MNWSPPARPAPPADPAATSLVGRVAQVRHAWENADGSLTLLADLEGGESVRGAVESRAELTPGATYKFLGRWREHDRHGHQFAFDAALLETPDDPDGMAAYLSRHADRVGLVTAGRLVAAYGADAARVLVEETARVSGDGILSEADAALAAESLRRVYADPALREAHQQLFALLRGHGFYAKAIKAALRRWRASAVAQVRRDPFLMLTHGMPGCGFLKCDRLYLALGRSPRRLKRQALAAWHALACLDGDTWADVGEALRAVREQIGGAAPRERRAVALLCRARLAECVTDPASRVWLAERHKAAAERACARMVRTLSQAPASWPDPETLGLDPAADAHQVGQLRAALSSPVALLNGGPGTGKTHCAALVIRATVAMVGAAKVAVCAPTGKAAVRISEKLADAGIPTKATTVHALLGVAPVETASGDGWGFRHGPDNPLPHSHVFVDETSMMDVGLAACLLSALTPGANLLLVGDPGQLPPVGHGAFLRDLIAAGTPLGLFSEIRRNAGLIVRACHAIKDGQVPRLPNDLSTWQKDESQNLVQLPWPEGSGRQQQKRVTDRLDEVYDWLAHCCDRFQTGEWNLVDDVQVIVARNATREALNRHLQARLNAAGLRGPAGSWRVGDKVICLKNGFVISAEDRNGRQVYVCNGDLGRVEGFRGKHAVVRLSSPPRAVLVPLTRRAEEEQAAHAGEADAGGVGGRWDLAYAVTCHKYQGSEVRVAVVLVEGAGRLGSREWLYTAASRARSLCVLLGDRDDVRRYVRNVTLPDRKTFLVERLKGEM